MSVFKKHRGKRITAKDKNWSKGTWYVWRRVQGKIIHKALKGAQTKEEAEAAEREIIRKAFRQQYGLPDNSTTFTEFTANQYARYVEQNNVSLATKRLYVRLLLEPLAGRALADITPQDLRNIQAGFRKRYSASTVNQIMSTASKIFTLACQEGILDRNPMQFVTRLKEPPPRARLLSKEEWERLWKELEKDGLLLRMVSLALNLPLRRGQLLAISPDAVNFQSGQLLASQSKGRPSRYVPLNATATNICRQMIEDGQLPFPLKETGLRKRWKRALHRAGIENFRFHDLRKEQATTLIINGVNPEIVRQLFGHSAMKITQKYMMPGFEAMREAVNSLDEKVMEAEGVQ